MFKSVTATQTNKQKVNIMFNPMTSLISINNLKHCINTPDYQFKLKQATCTRVNQWLNNGRQSAQTQMTRSISISKYITTASLLAL